MSLIQPDNIKTKSGEAIKIRCAEIGDARDLIEYMMEILKNDTEFMLTKPQEVKVSEEDEVNWIQDHLSSPGKIILVAEQKGRIVGVLHFANRDRQRNLHTGSFGMSVHKDLRRQGIGKTLVQTLLDWAKKSTIIEKVCCEVFSTNVQAIEFYKSLGFAEEGKCPKAYRLGEGNYAGNILMYKFTD